MKHVRECRIYDNYNLVKGEKMREAKIETKGK